jgi:hypothetical protein
MLSLHARLSSLSIHMWISTKFHQPTEDTSETQKGSGAQLDVIWVSTLSITCVRLVIHCIVWRMIFVFVMSGWQNHTLTRLVILFCSERNTWTLVCLAKNLVLLLLGRLPSNLFWVPPRCVSIIRSVFNSWILRSILPTCDRTDFVHPMSVLH